MEVLQSLTSSLWDFLVREWNQHPYHILSEFFFVAFILYLLPQKSYNPKKYKAEKLTEKEIDDLCAEWEPEPLFTMDEEAESFEPPVVTRTVGRTVTVNGKEALNFATNNFLGFVGDKAIEKACEKTIRTYGVGTCGPRGFYGTIDVHLDLEKRIAEFMGTEESILYAYGFSTIASAIPAFAKRGDILVVDKAVRFSVQTGVQLSRSHIHYFEHNDMEDLDRILKTITSKDKKKTPENRRFIVVEGLYYNTGEICHLEKVLEMKNKYKFRIIMDDSIGIGVLGKTGRGTREYFGIKPEEIDILTCGLENSLGSVGGFCCGSHMVVDHQRLSGSGYCFSASLPSFLTTAAREAIDRIDKDPGMLQDLQRKTAALHDELKIIKKMTVVGNVLSPVVHLRLEHPSGNRREDELLLQRITDEALKKGVACTVSKYSSQEQFLPPLSIRVAVSVLHTLKDIKSASKMLKAAVEKFLK